MDEGVGEQQPVGRRLVLLVASVAAAALAACAGAPADTAAPDVSPTPSVAASPTGSAPVAPSPTGVTLGAASAPPSVAAAQNAFEISYAEDRASGDTGRLVVGLGDGWSFVQVALGVL